MSYKYCPHCGKALSEEPSHVTLYEPREGLRGGRNGQDADEYPEIKNVKINKLLNFLFKYIQELKPGSEERRDVAHMMHELEIGHLPAEIEKKLENLYKRATGNSLGNYRSEISFEQALDELHDAAHAYKADPSRTNKIRLNKAEAQLNKTKMEFALGDGAPNKRGYMKGIDADPAKWRKYWDTMTEGYTHKKGAIIRALKRAHAKVKNPGAFARALEERFG